jgi:hypothetical protein
MCHVPFFKTYILLPSFFISFVHLLWLYIYTMEAIVDTLLYVALEMSSAVDIYFFTSLKSHYCTSPLTILWREPLCITRDEIGCAVHFCFANGCHLLHSSF